MPPGAAHVTSAPLPLLALAGVRVVGAYSGAVNDSTQPPARSFGTVADRYDRYRPTYAADAVVWALGERPLRVADVGAGTGILSRLLERLGHEVIAIESDDLMRGRLVQASPGITALAGTAEEIPLPDRTGYSRPCGTTPI